MELVADTTFTATTIELDGKHFRNCAFESCELLYDGGVVTFERTLFKDCSYAFAGQARRTVDLLRVIGLMESHAVSCAMEV